MGEAKRRRAMMAKAFEAIRETFWTTLGDAAERVGCERGDLLALLLEKGMLLGGFDEGELDRFVARMEQIERELDQHLRTPPQAAPEPQDGPVLPPLPNTGAPAGDPRLAAAQFARQRAGQRLGDQPVEQHYHAHMTAVVQVLDKVFNGEVGGPDRETGFVLMVFPFGDHSGRCNYMSNGADRRDVVTLMKEMVARFEGQPEMTGRA